MGTLVEWFGSVNVIDWLAFLLAVTLMLLIIIKSKIWLIRFLL